MKERFIAGDRTVVADDQPAKIAEPCKSAFDFPAALVAAQPATILSGRFAAIVAMRRDQGKFLVQPTARAEGRCHKRDRRSPARVSAVVARCDAVASRGSTRAFPPRAGPRWGTQSKVALPEEYPGRRPPPSTSCPYPAWFFRFSSPLFGWSKTAV